MSRSYKVTGINLKGMLLGETDRLLTVLTVERGLVRVIVPGARKHQSRLAGRSSQFVVNELLIVKGRQLDRLVQAETLRSFPGLSQNLARLTASQYLAELALCQALSEQPQADLFTLLVEQLQRLEQVNSDQVLPCLSQGIFHLLTLAGVAPEVSHCSLSRTEIVPDLRAPDWRIGFDPSSGGIVSLSQITHQMGQQQRVAPCVRTPRGRYPGNRYPHRGEFKSRSLSQTRVITALELTLLQRLGNPQPIVEQPLVEIPSWPDDAQPLWRRVEQLLRQYAQYHFDRPIRSATLIDECFSVAVPSD